MWQSKLDVDVQDHHYIDSIYTKDTAGHTVELTIISLMQDSGPTGKSIKVKEQGFIPKSYKKKRQSRSTTLKGSGAAQPLDRQDDFELSKLG